MTIKVYPSLLPGDPIETHEWSGAIAGWFESKGIDYAAQETQPITISVNGGVVPVERWVDYEVSDTDNVEIRLLPHGGVFKALGSILGKVFNAVFGWLMPGSGGYDRNDPGQGRQLETAAAKANQAKLGEVVPEIAGRFRRFPDYLTPPRRHFVGLREQWLEFHACIGPGRYQILPEDVKVGDTPFSSLGDDGAYQIFEPGADLSGVSTHEHWHTVDEVGGTSSGTAGLELSTEIANREHMPADSYLLDGVSVSIPTGQGEFPPGWGGGTLIDVRLPLTYDVTIVTEGLPPILVYDINRFTGDFMHIMPVSVGSIIMGIGAGLDDRYQVREMSLDASGVGWIQLKTLDTPATDTDPEIPGVPVDWVPAGNQSISFATGKSFRIVTYGENDLTLERVNTDGSADASWLGFPSVTSTDASITFVGGTVYGEWTSEFMACPPAEVTNTLEVDFFFPSGLATISDEGDVESRSVQAEIQYRNANTSGARITLMRTYTQATLDQIGVTEQIPVSGIRPAVRVRRVGAEGTSTQIQDTIHWYGLKSRLPTATSYPNWTTMSAKLRSGGRIAAQSENQINVIATRILPTLQANGTWGPEQPTRDISAFARYVASTINYTDSNLDMAEFRRLHAIWFARGETLDYVFDQTTVKEALNTSFGAGMAEMTVADGQIRPVRDDVRTQFEHPYSPQNMTRPLRRTFKAPRHDDPDGVEVEYINSETWAKEPVRCFLPGDQGFKIEKITLDGVTDRTRAWRIGMRRRRQLRYRVWDYSFSTEMDAFNSDYLSYVPLYDDIPGYGKSAILEHIEPVGSGAMLHVSEPLEWESGANHVIGYRRPDGTLAGPFTATPGIDKYSVIANIPQPWPVVTLKMEPPHIYFGVAERWTFPALITEIDPQGIDTASVSAVNYDSRVYDDDNNFPSVE